MADLRYQPTEVERMAQTGMHLARVAGLMEDGEPLHTLSDETITEMAKLAAQIESPGLNNFVADMSTLRADLLAMGFEDEEVDDPEFAKVYDARFSEMVARFERPELGPAFLEKLNKRLEDIYPWAEDAQS